MKRLQEVVRSRPQFGPYRALELVMPGGTLLAFLLWLYPNHFTT